MQWQDVSSGLRNFQTPEISYLIGTGAFPPGYNSPVLQLTTGLNYVPRISGAVPLFLHDVGSHKFTVYIQYFIRGFNNLNYRVYCTLCNSQHMLIAGPMFRLPYVCPGMCDADCTSETERHSGRPLARRSVILSWRKLNWRRASLSSIDQQIACNVISY